MMSSTYNAGVSDKKGQIFSDSDQEKYAIFVIPTKTIIIYDAESINIRI